jgi:NAD(P)-dependent dehydrogenase (short-subunit alcohol dehydrogenase family)
MGYGATTTTDEVLEGVDLHGATVLVTGASGGIGLETARALAAHGATVTLAARDAAKLDEAVAGIRAEHPDADVDVLVVDLASLASVRAAAAEWLASHGPLTYLLNNAGVMCTPFGRTADGFETQFGTNHLGHFVLTNELMPALLAAAPGRIVNVSSAGHAFGTVDLDDPNFDRRPYDGWAAYGQSKTANIWFSVELDRRLAARGVRSFAVHPGGIHTGLGRYMTQDDLTVLVERIKEQAPSGGEFQWKTVPQGAATTVWAAVSPALDGRGGLYLEDCQVSEPFDPAHPGRGHQPYALDPDGARRLWALSEQLVGAEYQP